MHQAGEGKLAGKVALEVVPLAERLGRFRRTRNEIVHGIGSRRGRNALISLNNQREDAKQTGFVPRSMNRVMVDSSGIDKAFKAIQESKQKELRDGFQELREWYLLLVRAGSMVFEFEYWKRINR
jgi:nitrogen regulatory protein PII